MSLRRDFLRRCKDLHRKRPKGIKIDTKDDEVTIIYTYADKVQQEWVFEAEVTLGHEFKIWVLPI